MAEVEYMHICDYAFAGEGGKPCIIGVFENINATAFPATHPHLSVAIQLRCQPHEIVPIRVEFGRPNGQTLGSLEGRVSAGPEGGAFINLNVINQQFPEPGRYTVKVCSSGGTLATQSIRVRKTETPVLSPQGPVH